jgi:hypothetical protein
MSSLRGLKGLRERLQVGALVWVSRALAVSVAVAFCAFGGIGRAHGPPLAVHDVLTWDGAAPGVVRLLRGAAVAEAGGLRFVCAERWGGPEAPLMVGAWDAALVFAEAGFAWLGRDGAVQPAEALAGLRPSAVRAVAARDGQVVAAFAEEAGGALWRLAPGEPTRLLGFEVSPDSVEIRSENEWFVATEDAGRLTLRAVTRGPGGEVRATVLLEAPWRATPTLVWLGAARGLWLKGVETGGHRLDRVDGRLDTAGVALVNVVRTSDPIHGPVAVALGGEPEEAVFVVLGGALTQVDGATPGPGLEGPRLFCLRGGPSERDLFACDATDLLRVAPDDGALSPFLGLSQLAPPSLEGLDATARFACQLGWRDAARDAGLVLSDDAEGSRAEEASQEGDAGGCGAGRVVAGGWLALLAAAARRGIRRARPRRPPR